MAARIWIFSVAVALFLSFSSGHDLQIVNAERRIDLSSHIVNAFLTLKVENIGKDPAADMLLAFPPTQIKHLSMVQAMAITGKKKKKTYLPLDVKPTEQPDAPNDTGYFLVSFATPLTPGETVTLEVLYILTHSLEPFPSEIAQSESQLVYYRDSAVILSPYHIKQQTTFFKTPSARVESFTSVDPANRAGKEIKYGPYEDRAPYSYAPVIVHFENNSPFVVVEELVREIEISHWGSLQITEHYRLTHGGARHKGVFSRVDYQSRRSISGSSSFNALLAVLPPKVNSVYYRDNIGNISTSHLRTGFKKSELEFEPRYPLFGGWRATFIIGYRVPLEDYLFEAPDGRRYLNFTFGCPLVETIVNKLTIKVVLPEGSKDPSTVLPFTVNQDLQVKYSYLDIVGRTVVVLQKDNVVPIKPNLRSRRFSLTMVALMKSLCFSFVVLASIATLFSVADAHKFQVGGKGDWVEKPHEGYNSWAESKRFKVHDTIHFKYAKGSDSVQVVAKADYDACNVNNPIEKFDNGETEIALNRSGPFYFISGNKEHCAKGQKLIVFVLAIRNQPKVPISPAKAPSTAQPPKSHSPVVAPAKAPSTAHSPKSHSPVSPVAPAKSPTAHSPASHISPAKAPWTVQPPKAHSPVSPTAPAKAPTMAHSPKSSVSPSPHPVAHSPAVSPSKAPATTPAKHSPSPSPTNSPKSSPATPPKASPSTPEKPPKSTPASPAPEKTPPSSPTPSDDNMAPAPSPSAAAVVTVTSVMSTLFTVAFTVSMFA